MHTVNTRVGGGMGVKALLFQAELCGECVPVWVWWLHLLVWNDLGGLSICTCVLSIRCHFLWHSSGQGEQGALGRREAVSAAEALVALSTCRVYNFGDKMRVSVFSPRVFIFFSFFF